MNREELRKELLTKNLPEVLPLIDGQECVIFKADRFEATDQIMYFGDVFLGEAYAPSEETREEYAKRVSEQAYTGEEILQEACGYMAVAEELFRFCDWQAPNINDLYELYETENVREMAKMIKEEQTCFSQNFA